MRHARSLLVALALVGQLAAGSLGSSFVLCIEADGKVALEAFCACDEGTVGMMRAAARPTGPARSAVTADDDAAPCGPCHDVPLLSGADRDTLALAAAAGPAHASAAGAAPGADPVPAPGRATAASRMAQPRARAAPPPAPPAPCPLRC